MNHRVSPLVVGALLLPLGSGCTDDPIGPVHSLCSPQPASTTATFDDANLEVAIRSALMVGPKDELTCTQASQLTLVDASSAEITSLAGAQDSTGLVTPDLFNNSVVDPGALGGLRRLGPFNIDFNSGLSGHGSLGQLRDRVR